MFTSSLLKKSMLVLATPMMASAAFHYWNPRDTTTVPRTLSATGLYQDIAVMPISAKKLDTNVFHYEVNSPLWSDDAHKTRWVMVKNRNLPNGAGSIKFDVGNDMWSYPESTMFIKQFAIDTIPGDTTSRVLWETRFLTNVKDTIDDAGGLSDHWYGYSYIWRKNQLDADLVDMRHGLDTTIRVWPAGTGAGKTPYMKKWHFPSIYNCDQCHRTAPSYDGDSAHGRPVLGFFTAQLNRPDVEVPSLNQLEYFFQKKVLTGVKPDWNAATTPRWRGPEDSSFTTDKWVSLDVRARSYIAANCSGCHGRRGIATGAAMGVDLNYDYHNMAAQMEFRNHTTSWFFGLDADSIPPKYYPKNDPANVTLGDSVPIVPALTVPGYPQKSVILFRQMQRNQLPVTDPTAYTSLQLQMPPLATYEPNPAAVKLLTDWIKAMPAQPVGPDGLPVGIRNRGHRVAAVGPVIRGSMVILPAALVAEKGVKVTMTGINGRTTELKAVNRTTYALPSGLPKGVYIIRVGTQSFTRFRF